MPAQDAGRTPGPFAEPPQQPSAAASAAAAAAEGEEFTLLDLEGPSSAAPAVHRGFRNTASTIMVEDDSTLSEKLSRFAFTGLNVTFTCGTIAVAKALFHPSNFSSSREVLEDASKSLPSWFQGQYKQRRLGQDVASRALKDTGVLMTASGLWYGLQFALRKLRGEHDAVNVCVAGTLSAGFLGATFFEPFKLQRVGIWGAVGGLLGYYGFREQQALREALLERQKELQQKHMQVPPEQVKQALDPKLLQELLRIEQRHRAAELRSQMQAHGVQVPGDSSSSSSSSSSGGGGGGSTAGTGTDGGSSSGGGWGSWSAEDAADSDGQWQKLLNAAPWLQDEESKS